MTAARLSHLNADLLALKQREGENSPWQFFADAADVAARLDPERPVLCFSPTRLHRNIDIFKHNFPGEVCYAVKANSSVEALTAIAANGITVFDVASVAEIRSVRSVCPKARFHYHNPVKSRVEIAEAYLEHGCKRFAADDGNEINKIAAVVGKTNNVEIAVRFRLPSYGQSVHDFSTKFGASPTQAVALLRQARTQGFGCVLTFHPGSQCSEPDAWRRYILAAANIVARAQVELAALNVGGGFPARYIGARHPEINVFFTAIQTAASDAFGPNAPPLECEPGRGIVAPSQSLLTKTKLVKRDSREVFLNDGIYGALMEVSQAPDMVPPYRTIRIAGKMSSTLDAWTVYGPTCDPLDKLPIKLHLPRDIREDDFVEFGTIGAYGSATSTRFNGYGQFETAYVDTVLEVDPDL